MPTSQITVGKIDNLACTLMLYVSAITEQAHTHASTSVDTNTCRSFGNVHSLFVLEAYAVVECFIFGYFVLLHS